MDSYKHTKHVNINKYKLISKKVILLVRGNLSLRKGINAVYAIINVAIEDILSCNYGVWKNIVRLAKANNQIGRNKEIIAIPGNRY